MFESHCCTGTAASASNNNRFVYYVFYTCDGGTVEFEPTFGRWVSDAYGGRTTLPATPQVVIPASNAEIDAHIAAVANSAASGGEDADFASYFRDLNFGCPC